MWRSDETQEDDRALVAVAGLLTLAACGGGGGSDTNDVVPSQEAGGGAGAGKAPDLQAPMAVPDDAAQGGTITVMTSVVPATLDPTRAYYTDATGIINLVTRALTQYVYDPETDDMVLAPDMAADLGRPNEDNTEWTFTLRDGLKYEDGTDETPEQLRTAYDDAVRTADARIATALADGGLDHLSVMESSRPGGGHFNLRHVLMRLVEEYARHNGHADLVREALDGSTGV